jgi:hypothetical protein
MQTTPPTEALLLEDWIHKQQHKIIYYSETGYMIFPLFDSGRSCSRCSSSSTSRRHSVVDCRRIFHRFALYFQQWYYRVNSLMIDAAVQAAAHLGS